MSRPRESSGTPRDMADTNPSRGDVICVEWVDIYEDATGNPEAATLARRTSFGLYWMEREDHGIPVLVTTTTIDPDGPTQQGYCIYPLSCIRKLTIIKKARRKKIGFPDRP